MREMTQVEFPSELKRIGRCAFFRDFALTEVWLPKGLVQVDA
jgi:hypothetical protein